MQKTKSIEYFSTYMPMTLEERPVLQFVLAEFLWESQFEKTFTCTDYFNRMIDSVNNDSCLRPEENCSKGLIRLLRNSFLLHVMVSFSIIALYIKCYAYSLISNCSALEDKTFLKMPS